MLKQNISSLKQMRMQILKLVLLAMMGPIMILNLQIRYRWIGFYLELFIPR